MPIHLTTKEFFETCEKHLNKNGIIALNVGLDNSLDSEIVKSLGETIKYVYPNTYKYKTKNDNNVIIYASEKDIGVLQIQENYFDSFDEGTKELVVNSRQVDKIERVLTDDLNNIEQLQEREFNKIIKTQMNIRRD